MAKQYYGYILTNRSKTLYTGVTNNLMRRIEEHRNKRIKGLPVSTIFIRWSITNQLQAYMQPWHAKNKLRAGSVRAKKIALINSMNPEWKDLSDEWFPKKQALGILCCVILRPFGRGRALPHSLP